MRPSGGTLSRGWDYQPSPTAAAQQQQPWTTAFPLQPCAAADAILPCSEERQEDEESYDDEGGHEAMMQPSLRKRKVSVKG